MAEIDRGTPPPPVMAGLGIYGFVVVAALVWGVLWPLMVSGRPTLGGSLVTLIDSGLVTALLFNIARGRRWARTILAAIVFASLCAVLLYLLEPYPLNLRWSLATLPLRIAAVVLFFVPSARGWFRTANPIRTAPEGWHADPLGRHERRFWDGTLWTLQVADGQRVRWDTGSLPRLWGGYGRDWFAFRDPASAAAGWYGDPYGRHEVRFWDGDRWTARVADAGRMTLDEPLQQETVSRWRQDPTQPH